MIKLSNLISERFEIPPELQKQLENTGYSALGHILPPYIKRFRKKIFSNKELNEKSFKTLKNFFDTVRMMTKSSGGNTKLTMTDILVPEYYSVTTANKIMQKETVDIEKADDGIYITNHDKKNGMLPNIVINKDYAGWDLKRFNDIWNQWDDSYQTWKKEFDNQMVTTERILNTMVKWQSLDKPRKPKVHPDGQKMVLVYEKEMPDNPGQKYEHYFRVLPSHKAETYHSPNHFSGANRPWIVQTVYLDVFNPDSLSTESYLEDAYKFVATSRHEGRHLMQHYGNINKGLKGDFYGGPKKDLRHSRNPDVRGVDPGGAAGPNAKYKEPEDKWNRVLHPHRDVEMKTNLYDYKENVEEFLSNNLPKNRWKEGFSDIIKNIAGVMSYEPFRRKYPYSSFWPYSMTVRHLTELFKHDKPKFNEVVRELYKLIFNV